MKKFVTKLEDVPTEYYLRRVGNDESPMLVPLYDELQIGRELCQSTHVSRKHVSFQTSAGGAWFVKDLGSLNGIYRNQKKLKPNCLHKLSNGDVIGLGIPAYQNSDEFLFAFCHKEKSEPRDIKPKINIENDPIPNGLLQALGDLNTPPEDINNKKSDKNGSDVDIFDLFSIQRQDNPNQGTSSKVCANPTDSRVSNGDTTVNLNNAKPQSDDDEDIEIIDVILNPGAKKTLPKEVKVVETNLTSQCFPTTEKILVQTDTSPKAQSSSLDGCSIKYSRPGPLSKKKPGLRKKSSVESVKVNSDKVENINVTSLATRPELGNSCTSIAISVEKNVTVKTENATRVQDENPITKNTNNTTRRESQSGSTAAASSSEKDVNIDNVDLVDYLLKSEAKNKKCSVKLERLSGSTLDSYKRKCKESTKIFKKKNESKIKKRKGRVYVMETSSESEGEAFKPKPIEVDEFDLEKMIGSDNDDETGNMNYSQVDDVILISDGEDDFFDVTSEMAKVKIEVNSDEEANEREDFVDPNDDPDRFFPELSQAFYEGVSEEEIAIPSTSEEKTSQPKRNGPIQLTEPQILKNRPRYLCGRGEYIKPLSNIDAKKFYPKNTSRTTPPVPKVPATNRKPTKSNLKSKVQAKMGHRIPCPGGGSAIRPEPTIVRPKEAVGVKNNSEIIGAKRKTSTDNNENTNGAKKTKKAKVTEKSRLDMMIEEPATNKAKLTNPHFKKPLSSYRIPIKPAANNPMPSATSTSTTNSSVPKTNEDPKTLNNSKPSIPNGYARPSSYHQAPSTVAGKKLRFEDLPKEHEIPTSRAVNGLSISTERPSRPTLLKSNLKPAQPTTSTSKVPLTITPSVNITPRHKYNPDKYLALVLKWNVRWLDEQKCATEPPPVIKDARMFRNVETHYKTIDEHFHTYFPLLILETWDLIYRDWSENHNKPKKFEPLFVPTNYDAAVGDSLAEIVVESVIEHKDLEHFSHYKEGMLVIFDVRVQGKKSPTFGYIKELKCSVWNPLTNQNAQLSCMSSSRRPNAQHITLFVKIRARGTCFKFDKQLTISPVTYLRPSLRQVESLTNLHNSPLAKYVLTPHTTAMRVSVFPKERFEPIGTFNTSQKNAILGAAYAGLLPEPTPKVVLLQGPPGTGKTHTCVGLIQQLLYGRGHQDSGRRLLVLAPSNAAIDEITRRLIKLKPSIDAKHPDKPLNIVRVGQLDSMHSDVKEFSVDEIALKQSAKNDRQTEDNLNMETNELQAKINSLTTVVESRVCKSLPVERENFKIASLHAHMKKIEGRKIQLNQYSDRFSKKDPQTKNHIVSYKKQIVANANVILTTLASCRQSIIDSVFGPNAKSRLKFTACIVDEASQCCEPDILLPLQYQITKLILIGDPQQLPATILSQKAASFNFQKSLFERFYDYYRSKESPIVMLKEQYRMHSEICSFPSKYFYNNALYTSNGVDRTMNNFPLKPFVFFDLEDSKESNNSSNTSFQNDAEAKIIRKMCNEIVQIVPNNYTIGIITPYQGQRKLLMRNFPQPTLRRFEFNTVDGFQGREKDITILSCVRANDDQTIGFLKCPQRLNVAITRACKSLIICGHIDSLIKHDHWKSLIENAKSRDLVYKINSTDNISNTIKYLTKN